MTAISKNYNSVLSKVNLLVVNEDDNVAIMLRDVLSSLGFGTVIVANDGYQAVKVMKEIDIDLIITDWELTAKEDLHAPKQDSSKVIIPIDVDMWSPIPPNDGVAFVRYIRSSKHSPNNYVAIIMLTSQAQESHIKRARDSGVNEIMLKPVSAESLCYNIIRVIDHQRTFITSQNYKGPCRRMVNKPPPNQIERRKRDIKIIRYSEK
ncbi:MAG: hypothetical protein R3D71_10425 [Rickettsiales bacterium]